jgi:hypothetical protein
MKQLAGAGQGVASAVNLGEAFCDKCHMALPPGLRSQLDDALAQVADQT